MSEDIHNGDEQFRKAYEGLEEEPSAEVWHKINAELDRQDAAYYHRKFIVWKYIACLFIIMAAGAVAYHTYFIEQSENSTIAKVKKPDSMKPEDTQTTPKDSTDNDPGTNKINQSSTASTDKKAIHSSGTLLSARENNREALSLKNKRTNREQNTYEHLNGMITSDVKPGKKQMNDKSFISSGEFATDKKNFFSQQSNKMSELIAAQKKKSVNNRFSLSDGDSISYSSNPTIEKKESKDSVLQAQNIAVTKSPSAYSSQQQATVKTKPLFLRYQTIVPFASADFMSYQLDNDDRHRNSNEPDDRDDIQERENHEFSYSAGVMAMLQYNKKTGFKTGLQYSKTGISIQPQILYAERADNSKVSYKFTTSSGYAFVDAKDGNAPSIGDSITSGSAEHSLQYLSVPLIVTYKLYNRKKFSIDAGAGLAAHLLLSSKVETEIEDALGEEHVSIHKLKGLRRRYFSFVADASLQWRINQQLGFVLLPSFKYAITPITKENIVKTFPFGIGIGGGIFYRL